MTGIPENTGVVIVGAGLSGLMMAAQLLRNGIHPVIMDVKTQSADEAEAIVIHPSSLEIFRQMDLSDLLISKGNKVSEIAFHHDPEKVVSFLLEEGREQVFPYTLSLELNQAERVLIDYLTANTCPIYWNSELLDVRQNDENVQLRILRNGNEEHVQCDWLIAASNLDSPIRRELKVDLPLRDNDNKLYVADVNAQHKMGQDALRIFIKDEGFVIVYPLPQDKIRLIGELPRALRNRKELSFDDLKPYLLFSLGFPLVEAVCTHFSVYAKHSGLTDKFNVQRCFLIGKAAGVQPSILGQEINLGLQEAHNLGWKLSGVLKREYDPQILGTYAEERHPVAVQVLRNSNHVFNQLKHKSSSAGNSIARFFKRTLRFPPDEKPYDPILSAISQRWISYQDSRLSVHHSQLQRIRAGDKLPYIKFYDEKLGVEADLHSWCSKTGFTLLVIGKLGSRDLFLLAKWIRQTYPFNLNFYYLPFSEKNKHVFEYFEISEKRSKAFIVRPDLYIGYLSDAVVIEMIDNYLKEIVGMH